MIIKIIRYMQGYVKIRISGYAPERFLNLCASRNILLWQLVREDETYTCFLSAKNFLRLIPITRKTKTTVRILEKRGFFLFLHFLRKRKVFFISISLSIMIFTALSFFIWDITISGNSAHSKEELLDFLKENRIESGCAKHTLSSEEIVRLLRTNYSDIVWVSAKIKGTRLFIDLRENETALNDEVQEDMDASDLLAGMTGSVTDIVTRKGTPLVKVGDTVKAGQPLVLGRLEITGDDGEAAAYQYCHADADISIKTTIPYSETMPLAFTKKDFTGKKQHQLHLSIFKKQLHFGRKVCFSDWESSMRSYPVRIGKNFYLPITFSIKTLKEYTKKESVYSENEAARIMETKLKLFCEDLEKKGVQILEKDVRIMCDGKNCIASGNLVILNREQKRGATEVIDIQKEEEQPDESGGNHD